MQLNSTRKTPFDCSLKRLRRRYAEERCCSCRLNRALPWCASLQAPAAADCYRYTTRQIESRLALTSYIERDERRFCWP